MFLSPLLYIVVESSGKTDGKVALGLHMGVSGGPNSHLTFHRKHWSVYHC